MQVTRAARYRIGFWLIVFSGLMVYAGWGQVALQRESPKTLLINELVAANHTGLTDEDNDYSDWVEIYNPGRRAVNLSGWALTDDPAQPERWSFPETSLPGGRYLVVFASGKDRRKVDGNSALHTNFKLDRSTEFLGLYNSFERRFIDIAAPPSQAEGEVRYPTQVADVAFGRYLTQGEVTSAETRFGYLAEPSPGQVNSDRSAMLGVVDPVQFSRPRGFYETPFSLELSTTLSGTTIYYTTDGNSPDEKSGTLYTGPIPIESTSLIRAAAYKAGFRPSPAATHSFIFLDDVITQPDNPAGFPRSWGGYKGSPVMADYEMDPEIVNDPVNYALIRQALTAIPSLSLVTTGRNFHDLYANPSRRGRAWERPVSVEFIGTHPEQPGFQIDAGIRIQGDLGRSEFIPKHGLRLFFRREYGAGRLHYPLFPDSPIEEFDTLILRGGVNRSYAGYPEREDELRLTTYTRDEWLRASQLAMSGAGARGIFVHLYLNGLYWGLYNLVERPDAAYMASYFGGTEAEWQAFNHADTLDGTSDRFRTLHQLASEGHLDDPERYALISGYLDLPQFIDYMILNWYSGNLDWAFNNWYAGARQPNGQVRYFVWDGERTWFEGAEIYMEMDEYLGRPNLIKPLFEALMGNPDFRVMLADRLYKHLFNNGPLTDENSRNRWLKLADLIEQVIGAESARWGDAHLEPPLTQIDWLKARDDVLTQMEDNAAQLIALARESDYYPAFDPPLFVQQSGAVQPGFRLTMSMPAPEIGIIYYTTDGSDPRLLQSGGIAPGAKRYQGPLRLGQNTLLKARIYDGQNWSALNEAMFTIDQATAGPLQITEIMYNPVGGSDYEFIELENSGNVELDLNGISFHGIEFEFSATGVTALDPGGRIVLVRNPEAFARRYPGVAIDGVYRGQLSNGGEEIAVSDDQDNLLISLRYDDENGWPLSADGRGDSLTLFRLDGDPNDAANWRASLQINGSPGTEEIPAALLSSKD